MERSNCGIIFRGGVVLFSPMAALKKIREMRDNCETLLGFDGFFVFPNNKIQISQEYSLDLSNSESKEEAWIAAEQKIKGLLDSDIWFELVTD